MTFHTANLLLENHVPEPGLELTLPQRCRGNAHGILTATKQDVRLRRCKCSTVQGRLRHESLENGDCTCLMDLQASPSAWIENIYSINLLLQSYPCYW